jgi:SpoIIAA-like
MLTLIDNLPANVIGVSAEGKVTGLDYETVLIPAVEKKLKSEKRIRLLYHLASNFSDFDLKAMLDDAKVGMNHLHAWEKVALVSDHTVINNIVKFFGHLFPCEFRIFKNAELGEAKKWISESNHK